MPKASSGKTKKASVQSAGKPVVEWSGPHNSGCFWRAETFPTFFLWRWRKNEWWVQCDLLNIYDQVKARGIGTAKKAAIELIAERLAKLAAIWNERTKKCISSSSPGDV